MPERCASPQALAMKRRPRKRVIFVVVAVSSMKTSRCACSRMRG
jgi:hypothetical protein